MLRAGRRRGSSRGLDFIALYCSSGPPPTRHMYVNRLQVPGSISKSYLLVGKCKRLCLTVKVFDNQSLGIGDDIHVVLHNVVNHALKYG